MADPVSTYTIPNVHRRRVLTMASKKDEKINIIELIAEHRNFSYALEAAYKIIQNMPKDVRKPFLRACEEIK